MIEFNYPFEIPKSNRFIEILDINVSRNPDKIAVNFPLNGSYQSLTYQQLKKLVNFTASKYYVELRDLQISDNEVVCFLSEHGFDYMINFAQQLKKDFLLEINHLGSHYLKSFLCHLLLLFLFIIQVFKSIYYLSAQCHFSTEPNKKQLRLIKRTPVTFINNR